jgi:hypothetical protein
MHVVPRTEIQWGGPVFRAPELPSTLPVNNELPFFVNFGSKPRSAR